MKTHNPALARKRYTYRGIIQGVGFRPAIYRCALSVGISGFVQNRRSFVIAEAEGSEDEIERFEKAFKENVPSAAHIDSVETEIIQPLHEKDFIIIQSEDSEYLFPPIPPDLALCDRCMSELLDADNRRYLYPFITCTQCGPRYSIVSDTPFDREKTSMAPFFQCADCSREYTDPKDRRFHSQTNSCSKCGPALTVKGREETGRIKKIGDPVLAAIEALKSGKVVAVQGIGGFHLAADPSFPEAVRKLRKDKERKTKPFALMVKDLAEAHRLCYIDQTDEIILQSPVCPIVILTAREDLPTYFRDVSDVGSFGIMLPYTPLHVLLFSHPEIEISYSALIMTSGNRQNEPIITDPQEARDKLSTTADLFLYHNRSILMYSDDSIIRTGLPAAGGTDSSIESAGPDTGKDVCIIRRSRGYVPKIITLSKDLEVPALAVGGDLKNAPAYGEGRMVYIGPHTGDLEEPLTLEGFEKTVDRIITLYHIKPGRICCDLHPGYYSTEWAKVRNKFEIVYVQHHHAHILSVMAEHGLSEALGVSFDGTGYGTDGTIWGGEFLHADRYGFTRLGSMKPFPLPGGDAGITHPKRIAFSLIREALADCEAAGTDIMKQAAELCGLSARSEQEELSVVHRMLSQGINSPMTSSAGRIFDGAAAILGMVDTLGYEGEGPIKSEWAAINYLRRRGWVPDRKTEHMPGFMLQKHDSTENSPQFRLDPGELMIFLAEGAMHGASQQDIGRLAFLFHLKMAESIVQGVQVMGEKTDLRTVCLSGGVFQNMLLRALLFPRLRKEGYTVYTNRDVSPGDGGLALGQVYAIQNRGDGNVKEK